MKLSSASQTPPQKDRLLVKKFEMEKTKDIPGWYQRLLSLKTKPASELSFKQYCQENENRLKVIYPFLPLEQIKGKLHDSWKKEQPVKNKTPEKFWPKKQKKFREPLVQVLPRTKPNKGWLAEVETQDTMFEWLKETQPGANSKPDRDEKTYKGRTFVTPEPKIPEVISQSSTHERSILKSGRAKLDNSRDKGQAASRVSFTPRAQQGNVSPLLYSPPTPFVLSPLADHFHRPEDACHNIAQPFSESLPKIINKNAKHPRRGSRHAPEQTKKKPESEGKANKRSPFDWNKENVSTSAQSLGSTTPEKERKEKRPRKSPTCTRSPVCCSPRISIASSQHLEPPKFAASPQYESQNEEDKRFCLFEDESLGPQVEEERPHRGGKKKSPKTRSKSKKSKSFSWSSQSVFNSQQTPRLKKAKHSIFSQDKPETYYKEKRSKSRVVKNKSDHSRGNTKSPLDDKTRNPRQIKAQTPRIEKDDICIPTSREKKKRSIRQTLQRGTVTPQSQHKRKSSRLSRDNAGSKLQQLTTNRNITNRSHFQQNYPGSSTLRSENLACHTDTSEDQQTNANVHHDQTDTLPDYMLTEANEEMALEESAFKENDSIWTTQSKHVVERAISECSLLAQSPHPSRIFLDDPVPEAEEEEEEMSRSPAAAEGPNVLWHILFQLKNTAASSQGQSNPPSPARSRLTEVSEMSMKSPSSYAPSPEAPKDLMDYLGPAVADEFPVKKMARFDDTRTRGNILCNMFDESDRTDMGVPTKARRNLPSSTSEGTGDFSMLYSADTFV